MGNIAAMLVAIVGVFCVAAAIIGVSSVLNGYVLTCLWEWFVVPRFGLPAIDIPTAIGLGLIVSFLTYRHTATDKEGAKWLPAAMLLANPLCAFLMGFVVRSFL